ncbi:MAG TPA: hypothetical protein V6D07_18935 [Trichocoleus sp.]
MIKFYAPMNKGELFGFGLSETNLNRMEFNGEDVFFSFDFAGHPDVYGLVIFVEEYNDAEEMAQNIDAIKERYCLNYLEDKELGLTSENLRIFCFTKNVMEKFRSTPYWGFETNIPIKSNNDMQIFFSGPDEKSIEKYLVSAGLTTVKPKRSPKGFGT